MEWNLDNYYVEFSEKFTKDLKTLQKYPQDFENVLSFLEVSNETLEAKIQMFINTYASFYSLYINMISYCNLRISTNVNDIEANQKLVTIQKVSSDSIASITSIQKYLAHHKEIDSAKTKFPELDFFLTELIENSNYLLSNECEQLLSKMQSTGSSAWLKYKDNLIANHKVIIDKETFTLTQALNLMYSPDQEIRKKTYHAEIESYQKIEEGVAAALNAIKGEAITIAEERGFKDPLDMTIKTTRINEAILNSLITAIESNLKHLQKYLKIKSQYLGHKNGLPWYDLNASVVKNDEKFPFLEGMDIVLKAFGSYSLKLQEYAKYAYDNHWLDVYPKEGKVGGAFCSTNFHIKESRFLLNYGDSLNDVRTLAHELGHGYHSFCLKSENILNCKFPMTLAETASNFCEIITKKYLYDHGDEQRKLVILEGELDDLTATTVDIYSRFLFEKSLFEERKNGPLSVEKIKSLMITAQKQAYGDAIDHDYLHPYMWTWKPHYYSANYNFYNFPYTFGALFSKGLYEIYLENPAVFIDKYDEMLRNTGKMYVSDVTKTMNIDVENLDFWNKAFSTIPNDVNLFETMLAKQKSMK